MGTIENIIHINEEIARTHRGINEQLYDRREVGSYNCARIIAVCLRYLRNNLVYEQSHLYKVREHRNLHYVSYTLQFGHAF